MIGDDRLSQAATAPDPCPGRVRLWPCRCRLGGEESSSSRNRGRGSPLIGARDIPSVHALHRFHHLLVEWAIARGDEWLFPVRLRRFRDADWPLPSPAVPPHLGCTPQPKKPRTMPMFFRVLMPSGAGLAPGSQGASPQLGGHVERSLSSTQLRSQRKWKTRAAEQSCSAMPSGPAQVPTPLIDQSNSTSMWALSALSTSITACSFAAPHRKPEHRC